MLTGLLARNAAAWPAKAAIVQGTRRMTQQQLNLATGQLAARLRTLGVGRGDVVAIVLSNSPEFVIAFFAAMRLQAVAMPLNPNYTVGELGRFLSEKPVQAIVTDSSRAMLCSQASATQVVICRASEPAFEPQPAPAEPYEGDALYLFTSGSTGSTKRVLFTQKNLFSEALNFVDSTGIGPDDPILCPVPLYHSYGLCLGMLDTVYTGATLVLEPQPEDPFSARCPCVLALLREENVRVFPGVPWQFAVMAEMQGDVAESFKDVKWCMSSGDMLPRRTYDKFLTKTGRRIRSFYGSTEAGSVTMETGPETDVEFESVGAPLKNVSIAVRASGEIWIASPALTATGYEDDAGRTREVFRDGWYNSGDLGQLDARGRLFLSGRTHSMLSVGSYKVDAIEVEETLLQIPGVREAAVVGVEIPNAGLLIKAVLAVSHALPQKEVRAFCRQRLAMFKVPRIIAFVAELPRDPMGKILRRELASADQYVRSIRDEAAIRVLDQLRRVSATRQLTMVSQLVERHAAAVLGRDSEPLPRDVGFADLGMDSFASIELVTRLDLLFGPGLPRTFTFDHPTITAAAHELLARGDFSHV